MTIIFDPTRKKRRIAEHRSGTGFQPVEDHGQDAHATSIRKRQGAYLPHWNRNHSIYSVTFRLTDSLPRSVVEAWITERENIVQAAKQMNRSLSEDEEQRLQHLFSERVDKYLDAGHGTCWLNQEKNAQIVADVLRQFDGRRYHLIAWCVMPNHVHVVVQPFPGFELPNILHSWKSFSANQVNKALQRKGEL
ncbi:MAG: transposase [Sedimentisphaerales bacterium]|nr:transposase [Sedimentisphaerales bacterium]